MSTIIVNCNMSKEVYDYFSNYNLNDVAQALLERFDFTNLPETSGKRDKEVRITVVDPIYISLYNMFGPRSKKVSLGRLFEYGYNVDILNSPGFEVEPIEIVGSPVPGLIEKAYRALLEAQKYTENQELRQITSLILQLKEVLI